MARLFYLSGYGIYYPNTQANYHGENNMKHELYSEKLFSYGTLQYEAVQLATFGRKLTGSKDILKGFQLSQLTIGDAHVVSTSGESVHPILIPSQNINDEVSGMVFDVSLEELIKADEYEVDEYKRVSVTLHSGAIAWVYVSALDF